MKDNSGDEGIVGALDGGCRRIRRSPETPRLCSCSCSCVLLAHVINVTIYGAVQQSTHLAMFSSCGVPASIEYRTRPLSALNGGLDKRFPVLLFLCTYADPSGTSNIPLSGGLVLVLLLPGMISLSAQITSCFGCEEECLCSLLKDMKCLRHA